jgi:uncharacterized protein (UPF0261 family)
MMAPPRILVVGTADTKGIELEFLAGRIAAAGARPVIVDVGTRNSTVAVDVTADDILQSASSQLRERASSGDRGTAVAAMAEALAAYLPAASGFDAVIGIGGGGGSAIVTAGMRALPLGLPKIMVSTMASGDVSKYVDISDIVMMPAITDLAGLNRISRGVLDRAARAIVAMAGGETAEDGALPALGLTMFGVTTPCVTAIAEALARSYEPVIFHATGVGGRSMEALVDAGLLTGAIDITTTEIADHLVGGVLTAGPDRLGAFARNSVPWVGSLGALDMVNFQAPDTVPSKFAGRKFYRHNPNVTLMRTTAEECTRIGEWIAARLNACAGPVVLLIPEKGVSALDIEGGAFHDPDADAALFDAVESGLEVTDNRKFKRLPLHINDPAFAGAAVDAWQQLSAREHA